MRSHEVQSHVLTALSRGGDCRLGRGAHYLAERVRQAASEADPPTQQQILAAYWSLVAQGLAYIDMNQPAPENWQLRLTASGQAAVEDSEINPDDPAGYLGRLFASVPMLGAIPRLYIDEAVRTYTGRAYLACTVMLGVAAEAVFRDVAPAFVSWSQPRATQLERLLGSPQVPYAKAFAEFRRRLDDQKHRLPSELRDALDVHLNSVLDLLRTSRNDAGHPTGTAFGRDDCFVALRVFERLSGRMYSLKGVFDSDVRSA
jgi:hypothetical protein